MRHRMDEESRVAARKSRYNRKEAKRDKRRKRKLGPNHEKYEDDLHDPEYFIEQERERHMERIRQDIEDRYTPRRGRRDFDPERKNRDLDPERVRRRKEKEEYYRKRKFEKYARGE